MFLYLNPSTPVLRNSHFFVFYAGEGEGLPETSHVGTEGD